MADRLTPLFLPRFASTMTSTASGLRNKRSSLSLFSSRDTGICSPTSSHGHISFPSHTPGHPATFACTQVSSPQSCGSSLGIELPPLAIFHHFFFDRRERRKA